MGTMRSMIEPTSISYTSIHTDKTDVLAPGWVDHAQPEPAAVPRISPAEPGGSHSFFESGNYPQHGLLAEPGGLGTSSDSDDPPYGLLAELGETRRPRVPVIDQDDLLHAPVVDQGDPLRAHVAVQNVSLEHIFEPQFLQLDRDLVAFHDLNDLHHLDAQHASFNIRPEAKPIFDGQNNFGTVTESCERINTSSPSCDSATTSTVANTTTSVINNTTTNTTTPVCRDTTATRYDRISMYDSSHTHGDASAVIITHTHTPALTVLVNRTTDDTHYGHRDARAAQVELPVVAPRPLAVALDDPGPAAAFLDSCFVDDTTKMAPGGWHTISAFINHLDPLAPRVSYSAEIPPTIAALVRIHGLFNHHDRHSSVNICSILPTTWIDIVPAVQHKCESTLKHTLGPPSIKATTSSTRRPSSSSSTTMDMATSLLKVITKRIAYALKTTHGVPFGIRHILRVFQSDLLGTYDASRGLPGRRWLIRDRRIAYADWSDVSSRDP
ncbi:hypothetical protein H9P43_009472 [Blastocladiella emersonii ATCC 22665]|nr:hypothetical protein H9P43_009472 [Blastocladiella emersonii ATCC 22665]